MAGEVQALLGARQAGSARAVYVDVGCDHAGLPLTLMYRGIAAEVVAVDINPGPCANARANARGLGVPLDVRQGAGLSPVEGFVDVVSACGMGSETVISVLTAASERIGALIAQPNDDAVPLRTWALENDWLVIRERALWERGLYFNVLVLIPGASAPVKIQQIRQQQICRILDAVELAWGVQAQVEREALAIRLAAEIERLTGLHDRAQELALARLALERLTGLAGPAVSPAMPLEPSPR